MQGTGRSTTFKKKENYTVDTQNGKKKKIIIIIVIIVKRERRKKKRQTTRHIYPRYGSTNPKAGRLADSPTSAAVTVGATIL